MQGTPPPLDCCWATFPVIHASNKRCLRNHLSATDSAYTFVHLRAVPPHVATICGGPCVAMTHSKAGRSRHEYHGDGGGCRAGAGPRVRADAPDPAPSLTA